MAQEVLNKSSDSRSEVGAIVQELNSNDQELEGSDYEGWRKGINGLSLNLKQLRKLNDIQLAKTGASLTIDQVAMLVAVYTGQANTTKALKKLCSTSLENSKKKYLVRALVLSGLLDKSGMLGEYSLGLVADGLMKTALKKQLESTD
ncbi:hypothetical protein [Endozoicomonas sp. Mp262]|uniref:hypothetical protein n=1 Tax=Endozoicomonas sp. Mp262 TaxID=2919499 RepID=UPI0021DA2BC0